MIRAAFLSGHLLAGVVLIAALSLTSAGFLAHLIPALLGDHPRGAGELRETRFATAVLLVLGLLSVSLGLRVPQALDEVLRACVASLAWN